MNNAIGMVAVGGGDVDIYMLYLALAAVAISIAVHLLSLVVKKMHISRLQEIRALSLQHKSVDGQPLISDKSHGLMSGLEVLGINANSRLQLTALDDKNG